MLARKTAGLLAFCAFVLAAACDDEGAKIPGTHSEVTMDGRSIVVAGGSQHDMRPEGEAYKVTVDGNVILIEKTQITIKGETKPIPEFEKMLIKLESGVISVTADGKPI